MALTRGFVDSIFDSSSPVWMLPRSAITQSPALTPAAIWKPSCDVRETDASFVVSASIPGAKKEDVSVDLNGDVLRISGSIDEQSTSDEGKMHCTERTVGKFSRSFTLPQNVDTEGITAEHKDGVLYVNIPKTKVTKPETKHIGVN